jgi:hypothetical protein
MSDAPRMVSARRCQYENPNLPKYIVPYEDAAQVEYELTQCKRELAEAREQRDTLVEAAQAVVDRWEAPTWKELEPTAKLISALRKAIATAKGGSDD